MKDPKYFKNASSNHLYSRKYLYAYHYFVFLNYLDAKTKISKWFTNPNDEEVYDVLFSNYRNNIKTRKMQ